VGKKHIIDLEKSFETIKPSTMFTALFAVWLARGGLHAVGIALLSVAFLFYLLASYIPAGGWLIIGFLFLGALYWFRD